MGIVVKLSGSGGADREPKRPEPRSPGTALTELSIAGRTLTPPMLAGLAVALVALVVGLWLAFGRGNPAASTPMLDTSSESNYGITAPDSQKANGMDTGTGSGKPAALNNGMNTGTGR
jgi:hypothetical protein